MKLTDEDIQLIKESLGVQIPKIQWSKFSPDRSEQYVIRVDTYQELEELRTFVLKDIPKDRAFPDDTGTIATSPEKVQSVVQVCPVHNKPFRNGQYGWFCASKLPDGTWCKNKPK
mgnify:CR=1 FL=1